jgi:hypothetical protein
MLPAVYRQRIRYICIALKSRARFFFQWLRESAAQEPGYVDEEWAAFADELFAREVGR